MFNRETRALIKGYLEGFIQGLIDKHKVSNGVGGVAKKTLSELQRTGGLKPFHEAMLPSEIRRINTFERSFSTRLGNTFEACAFLIAKEIHAQATRGFSLTTQIPSSAATKIEELLAENNRMGIQKSFTDQVNEVKAAKSGALVSRPAISDLYFVKRDGSEWFFEIKSPEPNKGQCLEVTQRLLTIHAMQAFQGKGANTYFAMAYNPYGNREHYSWTYAVRHLDLKTQVVLQEEFWTMVGDDTQTYQAVLEIYKEVGQEKGKNMIDQLAFGF